MDTNIIVHTSWVNESLFIWGEKRVHSSFAQIINFQYPFLYSPFELKLTLFQQDAHSFYGTTIETGDAIIGVPLKNRQYVTLAGEITIYQAQHTMESFAFPIEGISIPAQKIISHVHTFNLWEQNDRLTLAPSTKAWIALIRSIQEAIKDGLFIPTSSGKWELTHFPYEQWLQAFPKSAFAVRSHTTFIHKEKEQNIQLRTFQSIVTAVADSFIRSLLPSNTVASAYQKWKQSVEPKWQKQLNQLTKKGSLEEQYSNIHFQQETGIVKRTPFLSGLALKEPATTDGLWQLSLCVVDRKNPSFLIEMTDLQKGEHPWRENPIAQLKRDIQKAKQLVPMLQRLQLVTKPVIPLHADDAFDLFMTYGDTLKNIGFHLVIPKWVKEKQKPKVAMTIVAPNEIKSASEPLLNWQNIAQFTYEIAIGHHTITKEQFEEAVKMNQPYLYVNGEWIAWDPSFAHELNNYIAKFEQTGTYMEAWQMHHSLIDQFPENEWHISWASTLQEVINELYSTTHSRISIPETFTGELRPYQHDGASWLAHIRRVGFGCCLADDMGLGKSVQTIVYMLYVLAKQKKDNIQSSPFLIVCPTSLIYNWIEECKKFAPSLRIFAHHGQSRLTKKDLKKIGEWDVIITSYQLTVRDEKLFQQIKWNGLILDEAQHIKNIETKRRRAIRKLQATHRIALTGTPIENHLRELWSLLDVLNPMYFGTFQHFQSTFIQPIEQHKDEKRLAELQALIRPLMLRRQKSDESLQLHLPEKKEIEHKVHLSVEQAALYQAVVNEIVADLDDECALARRAFILKSLTHLKQICNHPALFLKEPSVDGFSSGKWQFLLSLLDKMIAQDEKVLIFTQYKQMGTLMKKAFEKKYDESVSFLHGSLTRMKRQEAIDSFQHDPNVHIFILSLKAGGVGLNLTAATNVIHYDRWWNPAVENQATDRAYRIGQTENVTVHTLITVGTLEERIDEMLIQKQALADDILHAGEQPITELSNEEIIELIQLTSPN